MKKLSLTLFVAFALTACTPYDQYDIDLMQDATASDDESSSSVSGDSKTSSDSHGEGKTSSSVKKEPPAFSDKTLSFSVDENASAGTNIGSVKLSNAIGSEKFSIIDASGLFAVDGKTGAISVKKEGLDYEAKSEYSVKIAVENSEGKDTATVSIAVTDVNEKPSVSAAAFTVAENSAAGTLVGTVVAEDPDTKNLAFGKITYSLVDSTSGASSLFKIDDSGRITVAQGADLDYEKVQLYYVKVVVTDKKYSDTAVVSIQLTDVAEVAPSSSSVAPSSSSSGTPVSSSSVSTWVCGDSMLVVNKDRSYKTVLIKDKCWMAENMRKQPSTGKTMCYGEEESNCETYGRLYDHEAAVAVCPSGWRLPKTEDYIAAAEYSLRAGETLDDNAGKHFKPNGGWDGEGGDDLLGFNALPGGKCEYDKECDGIGSGGYWWTSTEISKNYLYNALYLSVDNDIFNAEAAREYDEYNSVRCIKN